jgi:hypothetical protein
VHRVRQGVHYFSKYNRPYSIFVNVTLFTPKENSGLPFATFTETHNHSVNCCTYFLYQILPKLDVNCRKYGQHFIDALSEASLLLHRFLNASVLWRYSEPNFTQIGQETWKLQV